MVVDKELRPLHPLTKRGIDVYHHYLEAVADEILFKHAHPFKWAVLKFKEAFSKE